MKSPLSVVKDTFGDKSKLVAALEKFTGEDLWVGRTNKSKGLAHVSNAKLLRLHTTFSAVKEKFGTRAKLIDAIVELEKRTKDEGFKSRVSAYPVPRLWDLFRTLEKRAKAAAAPKPTKAAKAAAKAAAKSAPKKAAAAPKKAASKSKKKA